MKRFKNNINEWYKEMDKWGVSKDKQKLLEPYLLESSGMCESQERFMSLVQLPECGGFGLAWADKLRKSVAKKNPAAFLELEKEFYQRMEEQNLDRNNSFTGNEFIFKVPKHFLGYSESHC